MEIRRSRRRKGRRKNPLPLIPIGIGVVALLIAGGYIATKVGSDVNPHLPKNAGQEFVDGMKWAVVPCTIAFLAYVFGSKFLQQGEE